MKTSGKQVKVIELKDRRKRILQLFRYLVFDIARENLQGRVMGKQYIEKRAEERNRQRARRFTEAALELGGVLIKLGQYLSARFDLLPDVWIKELSRLQDSVPSVDFEQLRPIIEQDLNGRVEDLFMEFDTRPLASASLGQVHKARLLDGTLVAVKVRRPGIEFIVEADLEALNKVIDFLRRRTDLGKLADLKGIAQEFEITLRRELDYVQEGKNAERFKENLRKLKYIYVPKVHWEQSSGRVLTTEFIDGLKVTDLAGMDAAGLDRYKAGRVLANCYLNQLFIDGFFHADPHPGNLFVREGPHGIQVVFIDFGMVGELPNKMRLELRRLTFAVLNRDVDATMRSFRDLGFIRRAEDEPMVRVAISYFIDKFLGLDLKQFKSLDRKQIFDEISYIIYSQPLFVPGDFSFLTRAIETLIGICTSLSPELNFTNESRPFLQRLAAEELGSAQAAEALFNFGELLGSLPGGETINALLKSPLGEQVRSNAVQIATLPRTLNQTLEKLESGRLQVQFQSVEIKKATEDLQKSNERLLAGVLASGAVISGAILATASNKQLTGWLSRFFSWWFRLFR